MSTTPTPAVINSPEAPQPIGPYSQAILQNNLLFVSGQLAIDVATGHYVPGSPEEETERVLTHVKNILITAGLTLKNVIKTSIFLQNMNDFAAVNKVYARYFPADQAPPARETLQVAGLPLGGKVEISCIAAA